MNKQEEPTILPEVNQPKNIMQSAKEFMNGVLSPIKGKDMAQMVEEYTAEMTLVAEGLSEDQQRLKEETSKLSAQQTELEQRLLDGFHDTDVSVEELRQEVSALKSRLEKAEKSISDHKDKKTSGIAAILRQATWLVAIGSGAWIITTLIRAFT